MPKSVQQKNTKSKIDDPNKSNIYEKTPKLSKKEDANDSFKVLESDTTTYKEKTNKSRNTLTLETVLNSYDELIEMIDNEIQSLKENSNKTKGSKFLKSVNKRLKTIRNQTVRVTKQKNKIKRNNTKHSGFQKPVRISSELAKFAGWNEDELRSRTDVTKYICNYISQNNLQNPKDRRLINLDSKLQKLLGSNIKNGHPFRYCDIQTCLKKQNHFPKDI